MTETSDECNESTVAAPEATQWQPILVDARGAGVLCGKSERTWRAWDAQGLIPTAIRIGRSTLWRVDELRDWVDAGCPERTIWHALRSCES